MNKSAKEKSQYVQSWTALLFMVLVVTFMMLNSPEHVNVKTIILSLYLRFKRSMVLEKLCDTQYLSK